VCVCVFVLVCTCVCKSVCVYVHAYECLCIRVCVGVQAPSPYTALAAHAASTNHQWPCLRCSMWLDVNKHLLHHIGWFVL
jgi:hypothetical protein